MKLPDVRSLKLKENVLPEPIADNDRIVVWVRGSCENGVQQWQRLGTAPRSEIVVRQGICATAATLVHGRQQLQGFLGKLLRGLLNKSADPTWNLPNGGVAVQHGERKTDVLLAWSDDVARPIDAAGVQAQWPQSARVEQLGANLFAIHGIKTDAAQPLPQGNPHEVAEQLMKAARAQNDPGKLISALTDIGVIRMQQGQNQQAIPPLEEALALARRIEDRAKECDVLGNLATATIAIDPRKALEIHQQELALARSMNEPFAIKTALNHMGMLYMRGGVPNQAFACLEEALTLARSTGDRQHEAELLWLLALQHALLGARTQAETSGQASIDLLASLGKPQANVLADHLQKYRSGQATGMPGSPAKLGGEQIVGANWGTPAVASPDASGPGWFQMGFSAAKSLGKFLGSGMKRVSQQTYEQRQRTCQTCEHHTGMRCKLCGCFTGLKAWLPREECPMGKWKAQ